MPIKRAAMEGDVNGTPERDLWQREHLSRESENLLAEDSRYFLHQSLSTPCLNALESASGSWITDLDGRRYLDFHGNSVHQIGYGHPRVIEAVIAQMGKLPFSPRRYTNAMSVELARRLTQPTPSGLNKVLFAPGGTGAVGIALKLARIATGRHKTISMWDSFHGASLDAISVGGEDTFRKDVGPLLPGTEHVPPADPRRCPLKCGTACTLACSNYLEYVLGREGDIAAVIAEPVRCTTAVAPPPGYWQQVRAACDRHGALLIFDEIPTCLGRTGNMFALEATGVEPDILVIGKGLGGGVFPMAAVIARDDLDVAGHQAIGHYTHEKSPIGSAAALATLDVIEEEGLVERSLLLGAKFTSDLRDALQPHSSVVEVRGIGMLIGVEMRGPVVAQAVLYSALSRGLSFKVSSGTVLTLTPPLNISEPDLEFALQVLKASVAEAEQAT